MVKITFIENDGKSRTIDAEAGSTVMETAIKHGVPGIEAECGGACACATCHVYVDEAWREKVGPPSPMEEDMLDFGYEVRANSRLSSPRNSAAPTWRARHAACIDDRRGSPLGPVCTHVMRSLASKLRAPSWRRRNRAALP